MRARPDHWCGDRVNLHVGPAASTAVARSEPPHMFTLGCLRARIALTADAVTLPPCAKPGAKCVQFLFREPPATRRVVNPIEVRGILSTANARPRARTLTLVSAHSDPKACTGPVHHCAGIASRPQGAPRLGRGTGKRRRTGLEPGLTVRANSVRVRWTTGQVQKYGARGGARLRESGDTSLPLCAGRTRLRVAAAQSPFPSTTRNSGDSTSVASGSSFGASSDLGPSGRRRSLRRVNAM